MKSWYIFCHYEGSCQGRSDPLHQDERQDPGAGESEPHAAAGEGEGGGGGLSEAAQGEGRADQEAAESAHKQGRTHEEVDVENQVLRVISVNCSKVNDSPQRWE